MKITVAEARLLKNAIETKLHDLLRERQQVAFVEFEKNEEYTPHSRTVEEVTKEIEKVRRHYREVKRALAESNLKTTIEWNNESITLVEALELVKQLRAEAMTLQTLGKSRQVERFTKGAFDTSVLYKKALFDPRAIKIQGDQLLREANRLSILIDKANFNAEVLFDFVNEYQ